MISKTHDIKQESFLFLPCQQPGQGTLQNHSFDSIFLQDIRQENP